MRTICAVIPLIAIFAAGCESNNNPPATSPSRVQIVDFNGLTPPIVGRERVFVPQSRPVVVSIGAAPIDTAVFELAIDTTQPDNLTIWITDGNASALPLARLSTRAMPADEALADPVTAAELGQGRGVYWPLSERDTNNALTHWVGVAVAWTRVNVHTHVEAAASITATGAPTGGDAVELAPSFYYMAALGDSAMWGNGLREEDKFSARVARAIEESLNRRVIREVYAVSGAAIEPLEDDKICLLGCTGEAPRYFTSIRLQALSMLSPESMDLLLVDGCGNDISLSTILSPLDETEGIAAAAEEFCYEAMTKLLYIIRVRAPQAPIVVTGYFPFLSEKSDLSKLGTWAQSQGIDLGKPEDYAELAHNVVANSEVFVEASTENLERAVEYAAAQRTDDGPIVFADAGFTADNATFAADAWLWGLTDDANVLETLGITLDIVPEDPMLDFRIQACQAAVIAPGLLNCVYGSAGHPNPLGAEAYAKSILAKLREIGVLPALSDE
jgi:lysophospholipase L1-like esterase